MVHPASVIDRFVAILVASALLLAVGGCTASSPSVTPGIQASETPGATESPSANLSHQPTAATTTRASLAPASTPAATPKRSAKPAPTASVRPASASDLYGLANATLDLPVRPVGLEACAQGPHTKFVKGHAGETTQIETAIEADVDRDGAPDVVASIYCLPPEREAFFKQVVAFHRRADGTFATMGLVVQSVPTDDAIANANVIANVFGLEATPLGGIRVEVGDIRTWMVDTGTVGDIRQLRTYGWSGSAIVQTAGSTSFVVPPGTLDLSVSASPMTYAKPVNGLRAGTMTVTVRNNGATTVEDLSVQLAMEPGQADCADSGASSGPTCVVGPLAPGTARTVAFHHSIPACESGSECESGTDPNARVNPWADLQVRVGDQKYSETRSLPVAFG